MERDVDAAKTYVAIRRVERRAQALKVLYAEYEEVRRDAERVILLARRRVGEELTLAPVNKGSQGRFAGVAHGRASWFAGPRHSAQEAGGREPPALAPPEPHPARQLTPFQHRS
jgi:hypothetical protein